MIRHPYLNQNTRVLRLWSAVLAVGFLATTIVLLAIVPGDHLAAIGDLVASDSAAAQTALDDWGASQRASFQFVLGFDFLYDLVHNNLVAVLVAWGAIRVGTAWSLGLAAVLAWTLWLDTALNVVENLAYLRVLATGSVEPWHPYASAIFGFRTSTLYAGVIAAVALHGYAAVSGSVKTPRS